MTFVAAYDKKTGALMEFRFQDKTIALTKAKLQEIQLSIIVNRLNLKPKRSPSFRMKFGKTNRKPDWCSKEDSN